MSIPSFIQITAYYAPKRLLICIFVYKELEVCSTINVGQTTVWNILNENLLQLYHNQRVQDLLSNGQLFKAVRYYEF